MNLQEPNKKKKKNDILEEAMQERKTDKFHITDRVELYYPFSAVYVNEHKYIVTTFINQSEINRMHKINQQKFINCSRKECIISALSIDSRTFLAVDLSESGRERERETLQPNCNRSNRVICMSNIRRSKLKLMLNTTKRLSVCVFGHFVPAVTSCSWFVIQVLQTPDDDSHHWLLPIQFNWMRIE